MTSEWAVRRAANLADIGESERHNLGFRARMEEHIASSLQEAIERGKAEQDKAVRDLIETRALALEMLSDASKRAEAAEAKLARLENPDEALKLAVRDICEAVWNRKDYTLTDACQALARTLTEGKENSDG